MREDKEQIENERLAVVEDRQARRNDGTWIRWTASSILIMAVGALSTVISITQKQAVLDTQMSDFRSEWQARISEINASLRENTATSGSLKDVVVSLKSDVDRLRDYLDRDAPRTGPVFPNGRRFENK